MANVFISHRSADDLLAQRLAAEIGAAGHRVWLDDFEINIGDSITERISDGLAGANYLVLCYSSHGMSPWLNREWMSSLERQLSGKGIKILPVVLSGGKPPVILADIRYADLVGDWTKGVSELLRAIR